MTHLDVEGQARMVDVGAKATTTRIAVAAGQLRTTAEVNGGKRGHWVRPASSDTSAFQTVRPELLASISAEPLDPAEVNAAVTGSEHGAVVVFSGVVRNHDGGQSVSALEYQAHPDAQRFLRQCCLQVSTETGLPAAAVHRVGSLMVGDLALVAAVAAPHRSEAFAACAALVERIKTEVPIWKRQHFADGLTEWVGL